LGDGTNRRGPEDVHVFARIRGVERVPHTAQRRRTTHRCLRARSRSRGVAATGHTRGTCAGATGRAPRHDPALSELLRDLQRGAQGTPLRLDRFRTGPRRREHGCGVCCVTVRSRASTVAFTWERTRRPPTSSGVLARYAPSASCWTRCAAATAVSSWC